MLKVEYNGRLLFTKYIKVFNIYLHGRKGAKIMNNITGFHKQEINNILSKVKRQYFVGNLSNPQDIEHIKNSDLEVGITFYENETTEPPHWHTIQAEFGYILLGESTWIEIKTGLSFTYSEGDFFSIKSGTCYSQTSKRNTKILFMKTPSVNDKQTCCTCNRDCNNRKNIYTGGL